MNQTAVAYATAQTVDDTEAVEDDCGEIKTESTSNQDAVQTLIDAVQELIDNRQKPSWTSYIFLNSLIDTLNNFFVLFVWQASIGHFYLSLLLYRVFRNFFLHWKLLLSFFQHFDHVRILDSLSSAYELPLERKTMECFLNREARCCFALMTKSFTYFGGG